MKAKTTTLTFTAEELATLYIALNNYSLEESQNSMTWGSVDGYLAHGGPDIWHRNAILAGHLQTRVYKAERRLEKKEETVEA